MDGAEDNDFLNGGTGTDTIEGGAGIDTIGFGNAAAPLVIDVGPGSASVQQDSRIPMETFSTSFSGVEGLLGSSHDDTIYGDGGNNVINAGAGNDTIIASRGNDLLDGGDGIDTITFADFTAPAMVDLLTDEVVVLDPSEYDDEELAAAIVGVEHRIRRRADRQRGRQHSRRQRWRRHHHGRRR